MAKMSQTAEFTFLNKALCHYLQMITYGLPLMVTEPLLLPCTFACDQKHSQQLCQAAVRKWQSYTLVFPISAFYLLTRGE